MWRQAATAFEKAKADGLPVTASTYTFAINAMSKGGRCVLWALGPERVKDGEVELATVRSTALVLCRCLLEHCTVTATLHGCLHPRLHMPYLRVYVR